MRAVRRSGVGLLVGMALLFGTAPSAEAQVSRADSAAVLLEAAEGFEASNQWEVAEAIYRLLTEQYADTPAGERARYRLVSAPPSRTSPGRTELVVWSTLYGVWLGGIAMPVLVDADGPEATGAGLLLGGPVGFFTGRALARSRPLSSGQARAITLGGTWGTWQGAGWALAADLGADEFCDGDVCYSSDEDGRAVVGAAVAGGIAGIITGTLLSRRDISDGLATTANFGALWGTWFGFAASYMADAEDDALLAGTLLGGNAGLLSTALLGRSWNLSRSQARLVSIAGVIGGLGGLGINLLAQPDDDRVFVLIPTLGSIVGLTAGGLWARGTRRTGTAAPAGPRPADRAASLVHWDRSSWNVGLPIPGVVRVPVQGTPGWRKAVRVPLFSARF